MSQIAFGSGVLNGSQFGKVSREVAGMQSGTQPMERTSAVGNIVGGLTGADSTYASGVLARIADIQTEARTRGMTPEQVVQRRQRDQTGSNTVTRYAGSNPVRNTQVG
ncbi:hypothetical protein [Streptomyces rimosus]|uniref:hypothetical protein n=1 Tax=Streptomyces rimosus TaxID=1927 RepID=UPI0004C48095|nr:hypothetical protein [Streptomyces rimosus]